MREAFVYTEHMTAGYSGEPVLRGVELSVRRGEILTLIGPNGAGKSTVLKSMAGQLALLGGAVYLDGKSVAAMPERELSRHVSIVFTERIRPELMTCEQVAAAGRYPYTGRFGRLDETDRKIVRDMLELVGAGALSGRDFGELSDGQKQRVLLARALCQEPELLLLDEPTSYLDIRHKLAILTVLRRMAREKRLAVVLSLHELDLAERVSDRVVCIRDGRIDRVGPPEEIFTSAYIRGLYGLSGEEAGGAPFACPELERPEGEPEIFVMGGGGSGIPVYRRLQRQGTPFAAGILWENDLDFPVARALAAKVAAVPAFEPVSDETYETARELLFSCRKLVVCPARFGERNQENRRLYEEARGRGLPVESF